MTAAAGCEVGLGIRGVPEESSDTVDVRAHVNESDLIGVATVKAVLIFGVTGHALSDAADDLAKVPKSDGADVMEENTKVGNHVSLRFPATVIKGETLE